MSWRSVNLLTIFLDKDNFSLIIFLRALFAVHELMTNIKSRNKCMKKLYIIIVPMAGNQARESQVFSQALNHLISLLSDDITGRFRL